MRLTWYAFSAVMAGALLGIGCPPAPAKDYTTAELAALGDLTELMRVNAHFADPWLKRRTDTDFTAEDFANMAKNADYLEASARGISGPGSSGRPDGFRTFAKALEAASGQWRDAAKAKDVAQTDQALQTMLAQCKGCHSAYR